MRRLAFRGALGIAIFLASGYGSPPLLAQTYPSRPVRLLVPFEAGGTTDVLTRIIAPLMAEDLSKSYGSLEIFSGVDLAVDNGSRVVILGLNGGGKTTLLRLLGGVEDPDTRAHGANEGLHLAEFERVVVAEALLLRNLADISR